MNREIPLEITHLRTRLHQDFTSKLPEATFGTNEEKEKNFLSRALAAFAIQHLSGCTLDEAAAAVVDGGGDSGIDAVHYSSASHRLWIVQAKFFADGQGEPSLSDVSKFKNGLEALLQGQFDVFHGNSALAQRIPQLKAHFDEAALEVKAILVYSGIQLVSEDRLRLFEDLRLRFSHDSDYFAFQRYNLTSVHGWLTGADETPGVDIVELTLLQPGQVSAPFETYYGLIDLADLATLHARHGKTLVAANIRNYKGSTEVNDQILATIREEPQHFFYLNNGLTAYCERIEVRNLDRGNLQQKRLKAYGFSIVNGAQTVGSIAAFFESNPQPPPQGYVFLKIIWSSALACLEYDQNCDFCARVLSNRNSLWSLEPVFPATAEIQSRYHRLFRPDRSARTVWRAVQAQRAVVERMRENTRASTGKRKEFFENARWLVLHLIFLRQHPERSEELTLRAAELDTLRQETDSVSEALWAFADPLGQHRHFRTIFCSAADCRNLKGATMNRLAQGVPPAAPPANDT